MVLCPDYGLLLELHTLTQVACSYVLLMKLYQVVNGLMRRHNAVSMMLVYVSTVAKLL